MSGRPTEDTPRRFGWGRAVQYLAIAFGLFWSLAPVYWMLATSFKTELEATRIDPTLVPVHPTIDNYVGLGGQSLPFFSFFFNSIVSCLVTAIIAVVIATPAAYALSRARFRLRGTVSYAVLVFRMLPLVVMLAPLYLLLLGLHLLDSVAGRRELNQRDGIHPNDRGERIVAGNVWRGLRPVLDSVAASRHPE